MYRRFADWFLLGSGSPLARRTGGSPTHPLISVVKSAAGLERSADVLPVPAPSHTTSVEQAMALGDHYTAKMWAVRVDPASTTARVPARRLRVSAAALSPDGAAVAHLFVARNDARVPGDPAPRATLAKARATTEIDLAPGQTLYVIATNTALDEQGQATVRVEDITDEARAPSPPAVPGGTSSSTAKPGAAGGHWQRLPFQKQANDALAKVPGYSVGYTIAPTNAHVSFANHGADGVAERADTFSWSDPPETLTPGEKVKLDLTIANSSNNGWYNASLYARLTGSATPCGITENGDIDVAYIDSSFRDPKGGSKPVSAEFTVPAGTFQHAPQSGKMRLQFCASVYQAWTAVYFDYEWKAGR